MEGKVILVVTLVLLALQIQPVLCPQESISSPLNNSTLVSSLKEDPCLRVKDLMPNPRTGPQTLFCWFLYLGFWGYIVWIFYLQKCFHPSYSAFPILLICGFGVLIHLILSFKATFKTSGVGDQRPIIILLLTFLVIVGGVVYKDTQVIGWIGVALSVLSHFCRIASTEYYARINWYLLIASIVGSANGFLWLIHPHLCISREYKIGSYIIGCVRGLEAFLWLSRSIAQILSKIEGKTIEPSAAVQLQRR